MEKQIRRAKILFWTGIALTVFNVAVITTIFFQMKRYDERISNPPMPVKTTHFSPRAMMELMKLDEAQKNEFRVINKDFKMRGHKIFEQIRDIRMSMAKELTSDAIDTVKLRQYASQIGKLHVDLKMNTVELYINLKKLCTPEQQKELSKLFREFLNTENEGMPMGRGWRKERFRNHHGHDSVEKQTR